MIVPHIWSIWLSLPDIEVKEDKEISRLQCWREKHRSDRKALTLCILLCCRIHCNDGRTEAAERLEVPGLLEPPDTELNEEFTGTCIKEREGNGYRAIA